MKALKKLNKNYICAVVYGIFGSLGAICLLMYIPMAMFHERSKHPYSYPFAINAGVLSFVICMFTALLNICFIIKANKKLKTIISELAITFVTFILFFYAWFLGWQLISNMHAGR